MRHTILSILLLFIGVSCTEEKKKDTENVLKPIENKKVLQKNASAYQNYAVVFKWITTDEKRVEAHAMQQADQLLSLWEQGTVENIYYDTEAKVDKFSYFPNITFVVKAENTEAAKTILNDLIVVKKRIASYNLYPVGNLWLKRNTEKINEKGITKSYVAVWTTESTPEDTMAKAQNDVVIGLWNNGQIENAYFDIEGTQTKNNITDFVFIVNANSEEEAKAIIDPLPFVRNAIASYELHQVGVFWKGIYNN